MALFGGVEIPGRPDLENVRKLDLLPIPTIRKMHRYGMAIDPPYLRDLSSTFSSEMEDLQRDITSYIPPERLQEFMTRADLLEDEDGDVTINAASADQVGNLLFDILGVGSTKQLKKTKGGKVSTDKKQLRDLEYEHPAVSLVLQYRERAKLKSTYCDGLVNLARFHPRAQSCPVCELPHKADTWRVHTEITTTRTETGRLASKRPNLQNIPQRTELGAKVRAGFIASPGTRLVTVDFSQIELRMMAHLANCKSMIEVYEADGDIHETTAMQCFGLTDRGQIDKISHRIPAKTANFLCQYGGSGKALYVQLLMALLIMIGEEKDKSKKDPTYKVKISAVPEWLNVQWCDAFIFNWFNTRPEVREYLDLQGYRGVRYGRVWTMFGHCRLVPEMKSCHRWIKDAGVRQAGNLADQGSSAGLMKLVMGKLDDDLVRLREDDGVWCWPLVPVHDQLINEVDESEADDLLELMLARFDTVMDDEQTGEHRFRVPIKSDGEVMWDEGTQTSRWKKG